MRPKPPLIRPTDDLIKEVPNHAYTLIGDMVSAWSRLDMELLFLLMDAASADAGIVGLFVGRADTRSKCDRLIAILEYRKLDAQLAALKLLRPDIAKLQRRRNDVAHGDLIGVHNKSGQFMFVVADYWEDEEMRVPVMEVRGYGRDQLEWNVKKIKHLTAEVQKIEIPEPLP